MDVFDRIRYTFDTKTIAVENKFIYDYKGEIFVEEYKDYRIIYNDLISLNEVKELIDKNYNFNNFWDQDYNDQFKLENEIGG